MVHLPDEAGESPQAQGSEAHQSSKRNTRDYLIGIVLLLVVVLLWTSSNFITQALFAGGYHKPFLVTYLNTSAFTLYLLPFLVRFAWGRYRRNDRIRGQYEALPVSEYESFENPPLYSARVPYVPAVQSSVGDNPGDLTQLPPLTTKETAGLASVFCFFWFIANWSVNASLDYTSVTSSTILSSTSGFFTLAIGRLFLVESLTPAKVAAVITSFIGVLLVSLSDSSRNTSGSAPVVPSVVPPTHEYPNPVLGDFLAIIAAVFYALYVILLKIRIHSESRIDMQLFFGFVGAFNIVALFPVGLILHFTGYEPFALPSSGKSWGAVLVNMFITLSSDYIYVLAMLKTTPLVVTVGLSLTIPLAVIGDEILNIPVKAQAGLGAILVLASFGLVGWGDAKSEQQKNSQVEEVRVSLEEEPPRDSGEIGESGRREVAA